MGSQQSNPDVLCGNPNEMGSCCHGEGSSQQQNQKKQPNGMIATPRAECPPLHATSVLGRAPDKCPDCAEQLTRSLLPIGGHQYLQCVKCGLQASRPYLLLTDAYLYCFSKLAGHSVLQLLIVVQLLVKI